MMWKEKYRIGVDLIDEQHKELFARVADFVSALREAAPWEDKLPKVKETLTFMQDYVVTHFNDEEEYQSSIGYPGFAQHHMIHEAFTDEVAEFGEKFANDPNNEELVQQFAGKLLAWLINHVASSDQRIAEYVRSQGGAQQ